MDQLNSSVWFVVVYPISKDFCLRYSIVVYGEISCEYILKRFVSKKSVFGEVGFVLLQAFLILTHIMDPSLIGLRPLIFSQFDCGLA